MKRKVKPGETVMLPPLPLPEGFRVLSMDAGERECLGGGHYRQVFTATLVNGWMEERTAILELLYEEYPSLLQRLKRAWKMLRGRYNPDEEGPHVELTHYETRLKQ